MRKKIKLTFVSLFSVILFLGLAGCGPETSGDDNTSTKPDVKDEAASDTIKIGLVLAETGPASTLGLSEVQTMKLLQKQLDEAGPIDGKKVQLLLQDYETDDTKAVMAMDRLISEGVVAIIGATQVSSTSAIIPKAVEGKLPLVTVAPASTENENVFVTTPSSKTVVEVIFEWLEKEGIKKVGWVNASDAFGVDGLVHLEELIEGTDIEVVAHEEFDATATDMTVQLSKVKNTDPEVVIVWSRTPGAGVVARNFKALGFDVPMIQSTASANQGFLDQVKDDNEGIFVVGSKISIVDQLDDSDQKTQLKEYRDAFQSEYDAIPDLFAAHTHDAISMIVQAIEAGNTAPEDITAYLTTEMGEFKGMTGIFNYSEDRGTSQKDGLTILGIENNEWKYEE